MAMVVCMADTLLSRALVQGQWDMRTIALLHMQGPPEPGKA